MIPVLHSIDHLLHRFDQLSKCHTNFLSDFHAHFPGMENPLRHVTRSDEEQRQTAANLLVVVDENRQQQSSTGTIEDFHRRLIKNRFLHHPPSYTSHSTSAVPRAPSRSSSVTSSSTMHSQATTISQTRLLPVLTASNEPKIKFTLKTKPSVVQRHSSVPRRYERSPITVFTMETVNRLSKPKVYCEPAPLKTYHAVPKEAPEGPLVSSPIKRTKRMIAKPMLKKVKSDHLTPNHPSYPLAVQADIPTVNLAFPTPQEQQSSRCLGLSRRVILSRRSMLYFKPSY